MIPQDIVEQVRQASDIVEVIGQYVRLKKRGRNFLALCPFHVEKTPSFSVSPDRQIYHCFGCGKGGNVFTFLMEHENMTFIEAVKHLAARAGIRIPEKKVDDKSKEQYERLHYAHQVALEYFRSVLYSKKYHNKIMKYLHETRRISDESIELFQIGLSGEDWDGFLKYALKKDLFPKDLALAGLVTFSQKSDKYYDRFRQRLIFPIFNLSDKPIAFGGRALKKGESAKYVNSPETPLYSKSNVLYGLNFTRQFVREKNEVIIVEGYFDLISLYQAGIKNVVASSGTAFTPQQARLLARFTDMAYLFFDADSAGQAAALRSVDALYDAGVEVMVMVPPEGSDPDSLAKSEGIEGVEKIKNDAMRFIEYRTRDFDVKKSGIIAKEKLIKELAELASKIGDDTRRSLFASEAAEILKIEARYLLGLLPGKRAGQEAHDEIKPPRKITDMERELVALIINHPEHIDTVREKIHPEDFQSPNLQRVYSIVLNIYKEHGNISPSVIFDYIDDRAIASEIKLIPEDDIPATNIGLQVDDYIKQLLDFKRERIIDRLKAELKIAEENNDVENAKKLASEIEAIILKRQ